MTMPTLDPDPMNHLGKGIFTPDEEAELLAEGYIFAHYMPPTKVKPFGSVIVCKRLIADAITDMVLDVPRVSRRPTPAPVAAR